MPMYPVFEIYKSRHRSQNSCVLPTLQQLSGKLLAV